MSKPVNLLDRSVPAWKVILMLAWPTIVEQLLQTAVNYVDTAMVGSIGAGATNATAAIGVNTSTIWLIMGVMNAVGVGFSVIVGRRIGEGKLEDARAAIRQAVLCIVIVGLLLTAVVQLIVAPNLARWMGADEAVRPMAQAYMHIIGSVYLFNTALVVCSSILRCSGDTKTPMFFNIMTNVINVVLNFFLIYPTRPMHILGVTFTIPGAGLGVAGAAAATAAATAFSGICMFRALFRHDSPVGISLRDSFRFDGTIIRQAVKLGVPAGLERATISVGQIVMTALISGCGTVALSANQLANTGESLCYMPVFGFSIAATTLVSQSLGAGDKDLAYRYSQWCIRLSVGVMAVTSTAMFIFAPQIMDLFIDDPAVIKLGAQMLRIEAFAEPLLAIGTVAGGIFRGAGDTRWPFYISIVGMWVVRVSMAVILIKVFHWGLAAVWVAMAFDWLARTIISLVRFYRKKWMSAWA